MRWDRAYHNMFMPRYSLKVLHGDARMEVRDVLGRLPKAKGGAEVSGDSVCTDRVHMRLRIAPKHSVSKGMSYLKGKSALILFDHHPEWRSRTGRDRTFWARGYYVSTVGPDEAVIRKYVRDRRMRAG